MKQTGQEFIRLTHYEHLTPSEQSQGVPAPALETPYAGSGPIIHLPKPESLKPASALLENTITGRAAFVAFQPPP